MRKKQIVVLNYSCLRMLRNIQFWSETNRFNRVCSTNINAMYCPLFNLMVLPFFTIGLKYYFVFRFSCDFSVFSFIVSTQINIGLSFDLIDLGYGSSRLVAHSVVRNKSISFIFHLLPFPSHVFIVAVRCWTKNEESSLNVDFVFNIWKCFEYQSVEHCRLSKSTEYLVCALI